MWKTLGAHPFVHAVLGYLSERYLALVRLTTRFAREPNGFPKTIGPQLPVIAAMWHGQHFMVHFAWPQGAKVAALLSRHADAEVNARMLERLGVVPIRGSGGGQGRHQKRGGAIALREMLRELAGGATMVLTADVPKTARVAGKGIVTLAQMSGRPIHPIAVVTSARVDVKSWDRASLPLPFGRGAMVLGEAIHVPRHATQDELEGFRLQVEAGLNAVHERAFALVGHQDPGRALNSAAAR